VAVLSSGFKVQGSGFKGSGFKVGGREISRDDPRPHAHTHEFLISTSSDDWHETWTHRPWQPCDSADVERERSMMLKSLRCTTLFLAALMVAGAAAAQDAAMADQIKKSANPELIGALSKELNATVPQASGAAGALLGLAKTRLKPEEFTKVAGAVPCIGSLLAAAPAVAGTAGSGAGGPWPMRQVAWVRSADWRQ